MKGQLSFNDVSDEYAAFVEKYKPKKTTDDCYTPDAVYEAVAAWVEKEYGVSRDSMVRPFWPGGDYERHQYPAGCCVVDNPPFSIISKIRRFYRSQGIKYFLFAPALTLLSSFDFTEDACYISCGTPITYENGAVVSTSFVTNLDSVWVLRTAPDLREAVAKAAEMSKEAKPELPVYEYPDDVLTAARAQWIASKGVDFRIPFGDAAGIKELDEQKEKGKTVFGGGLLLSERESAERAKTIKCSLSYREKQLQRMLGGNGSNKEARG